MASTAEVAEALGISYEYARKLAIRGVIPSDRVGCHRRYDLDAVRATVDACEAARKAISRAARVRLESSRQPRPAARTESRGRKVSKDRNWFNTCLYHIARENLNIGDVCAQLSTLTGLPYIDIRNRVDNVEYTYSDEEKNGREDGRLSSGELKTLIGRYNRSKDPEIQAWIASIRAKPSPTDSR